MLKYVKVCTICQRSLPSGEFYVNRNQCRECYTKQQADRLRSTGRAKRPRITTLSKPCLRCGEVLPASAFMSNQNSSDGLRSWCRDCARLRQIERKYKITPERYREMSRSGCNICGSHDRLHVDHDHSCCPGQRTCGGCIRGVLCEKHNQGLGCFKDDTIALLAAVSYLNDHRPAQ
jgi:hypothetical protein